MEEKREAFRVSGYLLFKKNLLDLSLFTSVLFSYTICHLIVSSDSSLITFIVVFSSIFMSINYHIESYRAFLAVNTSVDCLKRDKKLRETFLSTHLGYNSNCQGYATLDRVINKVNDSNTNSNSDTERGKFFPVKLSIKEGVQSSLDQKWVRWSPSHDNNRQNFNRKLERGGININKCDSFHWMNRIIKFFWPYLSHVIHYELNEFFREEIDSGNLARSNEELKRLFYAILKQLDTNILVIERCQLGNQAPIIKDLSVSEEENSLDDKYSIEEDKFIAPGVEVAGGYQDTVSVKTNKLSLRRGKVRNNKDKIPGKQTSRIESNNKQVGQKQQPEQQQSTNKRGKLLVYNVNLEYNGDINIAIIYKYFCCLSSRFGLKDIFLHFKLRFILGPIKENIPFIDQVSFTLLELPEFGYKGIALAELAELKIVRSVINRLITKNLLYPRLVSVSLHELLDTLINGPKTREQRKELKLRQQRKAENRAKKNLPESDGSRDKAEVSIWTRLYANTLLLGCICSNFLLRSCQSTTTDDQSEEMGRAVERRGASSESPHHRHRHLHPLGISTSSKSKT